MVIPRSRSAGKKSVVVLPVSTDPAEARYEVSSKMDSVRVVFPESSTFAVKHLGVAKGRQRHTDMGYDG